VAVDLAQRDLPIDEHTIEFRVTRVTGVEWDPYLMEYVYFDYDLSDFSDLDYFSEFADSDDGGGDGVVQDNTTDGHYEAYQIVYDNSAAGLLTETVDFKIYDVHSYSRPTRNPQ
jgi:hypothetical protein